MSAAARGLLDVRARRRPLGVVGSGRATNEENFLAVRLARGALHTPHVDACLRAQYQALLGGLDGGGTVDAALDWTSGLQDLARAEVVLLVEDDLAHTHPRAAFAIMQAVRSGARLVTIGVARTQLSRLAWVHVPTLPGRAPDLPAAVREAYERASRAVVVLALGGLPEALAALSGAIAALAAAAGHTRRPGSMILPLPVRANGRGALEMGLAPGLLPGFASLDDPLAQRTLGDAWRSEVNALPGLDVDAMLEDVAGLVVLAEDLPAATTSGSTARAALRRLECLVVLDAFVTETVESAHVVLPIASPLETLGCFTSGEGRVQSLRVGTPPPGEARAGWRALVDLAEAVGLPPAFGAIEDVRRAIQRAVPSYASAFEDHGSGGAVLLSAPQLATLRATQWTRPATGETAVGGGGPEFPFTLARVGAFEWGDDPLVSLSPTLRRDRASLRKRYPEGLVEINAADAERLGVRAGWRVRLASVLGETVVPIALRPDVEPGVLVVPFGFRDPLEPVLGRETVVAARVERV